MGQGVDPRDREAEERIELVGDAERVGLEAQAQQAAVAGVGQRGLVDRDGDEVAGLQGHAAELLGALADEAEDPCLGTERSHRFDAHRLRELRPAQDLVGAQGRQVVQGGFSARK